MTDVTQMTQSPVLPEVTVTAECSIVSAIGFLGNPLASDYETPGAGHCV
jgi:hypothetical protein